MKGVNAGVQAWNWTTGKTKGDLAFLLEISGNALFSFSLSLRFGYDKAIVSIPFAIAGCVISWYSNQDDDKREERALRRGCLDSIIQDRKDTIYKLGSPASAVIGTGLIVGSYYKNIEESSIPFGSGFFMWGMGLYVRRADYLPPRKNVLSRTVDKVKEWAKEFGSEPVTSPAPDYSYSTRNLEGQLI